MIPLRLAILAVLLGIHIRGGLSQSAETVVLMPDTAYQSIEHFGASDCWTIQHMGKSASEALRNRAADLLFSTRFDRKGDPIGIGLSLWRFNIGAGSAENPVNKIGNPWRQTPCILDTTGTYDFSKQPGQTWFLKAALKRGCRQFLGFCNSPPYFMTQNGQASNIGRPAHTLNLKKDQYENFARFLAEFCIGFQKEHGISFRYISPFNEPEWDWRGTNQEGTPGSISEIAGFYRIFDRILTLNGLKNISIVGTESGDYKYLYSLNGSNAINNQIERLHSPRSADYIGNLTHVERTIAAHSYWTTHLPDLIPVRKKVADQLDKYSLKLWQSELCIMSNDSEIGGGGQCDRSMKTALYVARVIHHDLTVAQATSWQWWLAVSPSDYKDGLLYIDNNTKKCENLYDSKLLWAFGNFSRFIRPGAVRIGIQNDCCNDPLGLMISAYKNKDESITIVIINYSSTGRELTFSGLGQSKARRYLTSDSPEDNLRYTGKVRLNRPVLIPGRSITTLVTQ